MAHRIEAYVSIRGDSFVAYAVELNRFGQEIGSVTGKVRRSWATVRSDMRASVNRLLQGRSVLREQSFQESMSVLIAG